ncbi:MAG TPA: NADH-quinone oxidoreductase subunit A [Elusimicrobia bacterium]|nr:NADH-quinone oxidoreductase subunit A [Elusimicrobiota bacterium]HBT61736.1 NADH-quinone oxidoreductase subunit A [Elusimicrobiota bacterium]
MMPGANAVIFLFVAAGIVFGAGALIAAWLLRPSLPYARKLSTYECGIQPTGTSEVKLNIRFYVFALLFVVFDVEILYIYPWAVTVKEVGSLALAEMAVFLAVLFLGLIYAWRKGALVWE